LAEANIARRASHSMIRRHRLLAAMRRGRRDKNSKRKISSLSTALCDPRYIDNRAGAEGCHARRSRLWPPTATRTDKCRAQTARVRVVAANSPVGKTKAHRPAFTTCSVTVPDNEPRIAEKLRGLAEPPVGERGADRPGRHPGVLRPRSAAPTSTVKPSFLPSARRKSGEPERWAPKWKLKPITAPLTANALDQDAGDELLGRWRLGQCFVERQHDGAIEPGRGEEPQFGGLVGQGRNMRGSPGWKNARGMRLEGHHPSRAGRCSALARACDGADHPPEWASDGTPSKFADGGRTAPRNVSSAATSCATRKLESACGFRWLKKP